MEHARYHLVFEKFADDANKTAVSFSLKEQLKLSDAQLGNMMANRRTVLKENLDKDTALKLGKELSQAGLIIKAEALAANQKNSPDEIRKHLLNGGLEQYFASKYRHPEDEFDTRLSLLILAGFALLTYLLLPIIGLLIIKPILAVNIWTTQPLAALIQLLFGLLLFTPAIWLWPKPKKPEGIDLDPETEELLFSLVQHIAVHLDAPKIRSIVLAESPVLDIHQTPLQWIKGEATLELGLPILEALNMAQFTGLLAMRLTPFSTQFYARTWGLFEQWYNSLRARYKPWALLLNSWVLPMHEHQDSRGLLIARELVGIAHSQRLQKIDKRFHQLNRDWPEFIEYCRTLRIQGTQWSELVAKDAASETTADQSTALFRIESPALWALSTTEGYQKVIASHNADAAFDMPGVDLWKQFQRYVPFQERFNELHIKPEAFIPPTQAQTKSNGLNALLLNKQAYDVLSAQKSLVEQALGLQEKPKKAKDLAALTQKWRNNSAHFWPEGSLDHKLFPLAKSLFMTLQTLQQIGLWNLPDGKIETQKRALRDKQLQTLHLKWTQQINKLPAFPLLPTNKGEKLFDQVQRSVANASLEGLSIHEIAQNQVSWQALITAYWTFIVGQIIKPKTLADEAIAHDQ